MVTGSKMTHQMRRIAAGLRPCGVLHRRRQHDLGRALIDHQPAAVDENGFALARQGGFLLGKPVVEHGTAGQRQRGQEAAPRRASRRWLRRRRLCTLSAQGFPVGWSVCRSFRVLRPERRPAGQPARARRPDGAPISTDSIRSFLRASSILPCRRSSIASCSCASADQGLAGFGQRLQPGLELRRIAIDQARAGLPAGWRGRAAGGSALGIGGDLIPQRDGAWQIARIGFQAGGTQAGKGPVALGRGGGELVERGELVRASRHPAARSRSARRHSARRRRHPVWFCQRVQSCQPAAAPTIATASGNEQPRILFQQLFSTLCPEVFLDLVENINHADSLACLHLPRHPNAGGGGP